MAKADELANGKRQVALAEFRALQEIISRHEDHEFRIKGWFAALVGGLAAAIYFQHEHFNVTALQFAFLALGVSTVFWVVLLYHRGIVDIAACRVREVQAALKDITTYDGPKIPEAFDKTKHYVFITRWRLAFDEQIFLPLTMGMVFLGLIYAFSPAAANLDPDRRLHLTLGVLAGGVLLAVAGSFLRAALMRNRSSNGGHHDMPSDSKAPEGESAIEGDDSRQVKVTGAVPSTDLSRVALSAIRGLIVVVLVSIFGFEVEEAFLIVDLAPPHASSPDGAKAPVAAPDAQRSEGSGPGQKSAAVPPYPLVNVQNWIPQTVYPTGTAPLPPPPIPVPPPPGDQRRSSADSGPPTPAPSADLPRYIWSQLVGDGNRIIRVIVDNAGSCPSAIVRRNGSPGSNTADQQTLQLMERRPPTKAQFPMKLCEAELPSDFGVWLSGRYLRPWNNAPQRILVIGDTGCRVTHYQWQGCNDADAWPFARVIESGIARQVDLVIHVGDYHYREKPCPDAMPECRGTPWGDNWETWEAEFFGPARSLLESAFWVMARGNHEDCARAGAGWLHLLGPARTAGTSGGCREYTDPFSVPLTKDERLVVLDTAYDGMLHSRDAVNDYCRRWREKVRQTLAADGSTIWLVLHQPLWSAERGYTNEQDDSICNPPGSTRTPDEPPTPPRPRSFLRKILAEEQIARRVKLVWSGDTHVFELLKPQNGADRQLQLVAGMGGTALESSSFNWAGSRPGNTHQKQDQVFTQPFNVTAMLDHGSVLLTMIAPGQWVAEVLESHGRSRAICDLSAGKAGVEHYLGRTLESDEPGNLDRYGCFIVAP